MEERRRKEGRRKARRGEEEVRIKDAVRKVKGKLHEGRRK